MTGKEQWIHMVGICGSGMNGIAKVLKQQGHRVTGSDLHLNGTASSLREMGIQIWEGHAPSHVDSRMDLIVISSAVRSDNPEVEKAASFSIPVIKRGEMLARLHNKYRGIAVAGAHGKTTTSSMLAVILAEAGVDPTFIVGGELKGTHTNARWGSGPYFVCEADESDGSFLALTPEIMVVTNVEEDHLDYYGSRQRLEEAFRQFVSQVRPGGFAVLCAHDPFLQTLKPANDTRLIYYGGPASGADYWYENLRVRGVSSSFEVHTRDGLLGEIELVVPGVHNVLNAMAAVVVGHQIGLKWEDMARAMRMFKGAKRRLELVCEAGGVTVMDDYAHHPTEVEATLKAARQFHQGRLIVLFQPHRYTRTQMLGEQFGASFRESDLLVVTDVYAAGEGSIPGVSGNIVHEAALRDGVNSVYLADKKDIAPYLLQYLQDGDLVITMGAGDIWEVGVHLCKELQRVTPQA